MALQAYDHGIGLTDGAELPFDWELPTFSKLQHLQVYATGAIAELASAAYDAAWQWGHNAAHGIDDHDFYERQAQYDQAQEELLAAIRHALSIPDA